MAKVYFASKAFLEAAKIKIKEKYGNQENYAKLIFMTRKNLNHLLNCEDKLTTSMVNLFVRDLDLEIKDYLYIG